MPAPTVFRFIAADPGAVRREIAAERLDCAIWTEDGLGLVWIAAEDVVAVYAVLKWADRFPARRVPALTAT